MKLPLVSIVIPVCNTGLKAVELIKKLLTCLYDNIEIIVVDDGSTDDSYNNIKEIKSKKVHIYKKRNGGPSTARNFGIEKASGDYLLFIDSDDSVEPEFVVELVKEVREKGVALAMTGVKFRQLRNKTIEEKDEYLSDFPRKLDEPMETYVLRCLLTDGRLYPAFNKIFRADIVRRNKIRFDEQMKFGEDTKFVLDYLKHEDGKIKYITKPLYIYNVGTETSTAKKMEKEWKNWKKCFLNLKKWVGRANFKQRWMIRMIYFRWRYSWLKAK